MQSGPYQSYAQLGELFGDPMAAPIHFYEAWIIGVQHAIDSGNVTMQVNKMIADPLHLVWSDMVSAGLIGKLKTYDGAFVVRDIRGSSTFLSMHAFGLAIDLNAATNERGTDGDMDPAIVACFKRHGFFWGGDFVHIKDPMHFEWTTGAI